MGLTPHESAPAWHARGGVQAAPLAHVTQVPARHTWFPLQGVASEMGVPRSMHAGLEPLH